MWRTRSCLLAFACISWLGPQVASAASRADAIARGFSSGAGTAEQSDFDGRWLAGAVMVGSAISVVGVIVWKLRKWHEKRSVSEAAVAGDVRRTLRLTRRQMKVLRTIARDLEIRNPTVLLLCPSLLRKARRRLQPRDAAEVQSLLLRLAI